MISKTLLPLLLLALCLPLAAQAPNQQGQPNQDQEEEQQTPEEVEDRQVKNRFWTASVAGGSYMVQLDRISSISRHEYLLDGAVIVDEVTIDTLGQALARFYFIRPVTDEARGNATGNAASRLVDRARDLAERNAGRVGMDVQNMVVKKYPETTHAKTIEYRVLSQGQLNALYSSVRTAWENGRGREFKIR